MTEEQLVYNTRGKTAGSSGEDQNTDHHKRSPSELDPPRVKKDNSAYADDVDAATLPASETLAPERLTLPRDPIMGVRIYSHALAQGEGHGVHIIALFAITHGGNAD